MAETPIPSSTTTHTPVPDPDSSTASPADPALITDKARAEELIPHFKFERILNADQGSLRLHLLGTLHSLPTLLTLSRPPIPSSPSALSTLPTSLLHLHNLGHNPPYSWFLASPPPSATDPSLKLNLIHPCTPAHVRKYSAQKFRVVTETGEVYRERVRPWVESQGGRVGWVYGILDGRTEQEDVILRVPDGPETGEGDGKEGGKEEGKEGGKEGFVLLPDLNWDRKELSTLHLLCLVSRRDLHSLRDLRVGHIEWLKAMRARLLRATTELYPDVEEDELKVYFHYQPTYYHLHLHIVHVSLEAGATQAVGKAFGVENIIAQLEMMRGGASEVDGGVKGEGEGEGDGERGMHEVSITYTVGEGSELWEKVFLPLKEERKKRAVLEAEEKGPAGKVEKA